MKIIFLAGLLIFGSAGFISAQSHVQAALIAKSRSVELGKPFSVEVRLKMDPGWHTYYKNPGESGLPTKIVWTLPEGFKAGEIQWPKPEKITANSITNYVYEGEVELSVRIETPKKFKAEQLRLSAKVSWLECNDACVPGSSVLHLTVPLQRP